jgi:hypothetical protein
MTPTYKEKSKIDLSMQAICNEQHKFPEEYIDQAKALLEKWQSQNWGAPAAVKRESETDIESDAEVSGGSDGRKSKKRRLSARDAKSSSQLLLPPSDHRIWGLNGIMHGICSSKAQGRKSPQLDPRYKHEQRRADTVGDNGLKFGAWVSKSACCTLQRSSRKRTRRHIWQRTFWCILNHYLRSI